MVLRCEYFLYVEQGQIVVIPAGCAHQVVNGGRNHNIKVAQDFIAPESALVSLELLKEVRLAASRSSGFWRNNLGI